LYEVDGIDSTNLINYNGNEDYKKFTTTTSSSNSKETHVNLWNSPIYSITFGVNNETFDGKVSSYGVYNGAMSCYSPSNNCYKNYFTPETNKSTWKILKLDSKEMHLQSQQIHSYNLKFSRTN
jgi:hypothetical protein